MARPLPIIANNFLVTQVIVGSTELHDMNVVHDIICSASSILTDIADSYADAFAASLMPVIRADMSMGVTKIIALDGTTPTITVTTDKVGTVGGHGTGNAFPNAMAQGITWQTSKRGKSFRGRTFLPGVSSDMVVASATRPLTAGQLAALQAAATGFITSLAAQTPALGLAVLSRKLGVSNAVINGRANTGVVEQRRRYERVAHR